MGEEFYLLIAHLSPIDRLELANKSDIELSIRLNTDEKGSYHSLAEWSFDHYKMDKSK